MPTTDETYQPAQVAAMLGVNVGTIRRWTTAHAAHLSHSAAPVPGGRRKLSALDMEVLRAVRDLRDEGLTVEAINARLSGMTFAVPISTEAPQASPDAPGHELAPIVGQYDLATLTAPILARMEAIERNQRDRVTVFALGFLSACGLFALILLLFVLFGR